MLLRYDYKDFNKNLYYASQYNNILEDIVEAYSREENNLDD